MAKPLKFRASQAQEKRTAEKFGGRRQPQSGAGWANKNDVKVPRALANAKDDEGGRYLIENKRTDNTRQITLKLSDYDALAHNAALESREPLMHIEISGRHFVWAEEWVWDGK